MRTDGQTGRQTDRHDEANTRFSQFLRKREKWTYFHEHTGLFEMIVGVLTTCLTQYT